MLLVGEGQTDFSRWSGANRMLAEGEEQTGCWWRGRGIYQLDFAQGTFFK